MQLHFEMQVLLRFRKQTLHLELAYRSRGVARALTGDTSGAIKDFKVYVNSVDDNSKSRVQGWIKDLQNNKNPFTEEVLEKLRRRR
ncbi:MAG: hypothetical protein AAFR37_13695 [Cyanobacteria bacterium J06628_3]